MNNYDYFLNNYERALAMNDFNMLTQADLSPNMTQMMPSTQNQNTNMNASTNTNMPNISLYTPQEAYEKGNLFSNLYQPYKNYQPAVLRANSERERMFLEFSRMAFAAHELNLYLDNYPNNSSMLRLFSDYSNRANALKKEYEQKYGPLTVSSTSGTKVPFEWVNVTWPWEGED